MKKRSCRIYAFPGWRSWIEEKRKPNQGLQGCQGFSGQTYYAKSFLTTTR